MTALPVLLLASLLEVPPGAVKLLEGSVEYRKAEGATVTLDGIIERNPGTGKAGGSRPVNLFRLRYQDASSKDTTRELYVGEVGFRVSDQVGQKVRLHGKLVERKRDGETAQELWPAWMQSLSGPLVLGLDGVYARCDWQPEEARKRGNRQFVFRSGEQLAEAMRVRGSTAAQAATELMARRLGVPTIDWEKHMLICVSAGLQTTIEGLAITQVREQGGMLHVRYRLTRAKEGGLGFGYPAQSVLVNRSLVEVRFEQDPPR